MVENKMEEAMGKIENLIAKLQLMCKSSRQACQWRVKDYVRQYLQQCLVNNSPVQVFTLWCLSRSLEKRMDRMANLIEPNENEKKFFKSAERISDLFRECGFEIDWLILLAGSAVQSGQTTSEIKIVYKKMLEGLANPLGFMVVEDALKITPAEIVLNDFYHFVQPGAEAIELKRRIKLWEKRGFKIDEEAIREELRLSVAVKAAEGKSMVEEFGDFLLVPVEFAERYDFHNILVPGFTGRLLPIIKPYPWREDEN
jgi:hypothetical protein